ncbi:transmembrane protein 106B-like [Osmerus eperlanus]|uniref:transmembrane protein 106B-like n=1 Tax=Osmerus eperlanus TaxID=29151 RepID=UPI002E10320D
MGTVGSSLVVGGSHQDEDEKDLISQYRKSSSRSHSVDTVYCPTCQGTGRIPQGQESMLVAVIPCNDQRLDPRHTKLYVAVSVSVCVLVSALVLFFLYPRCVTLSPVAVKSVYVTFPSNTVLMNVTNILNITNQNFATVYAYNLTGQVLFFETVVGSTAIKNVTVIKPLSDKMYTFEIPVKLNDPGLYFYCKFPINAVRTLSLHFQMTMTVYYLAHYEEISLDTYEYIDCGTNTTTVHLIQPGQVLPTGVQPASLDLPSGSSGKLLETE